ncbi:MAG: Ig-like domain-containing protein, partial [Eubacterium sp.]|nr:Ig-like domain-containing protein [Eubacterium sp.]
IKWVLSDKAEYESVEGDNNKVTATENPPISPLVQIKVKERPVDLSGYRIELKTNAEMKLGETIELNTELSPAVYDDDDIKITNVVKYEPQDQSGTTDFSLSEDGEFIPAKAGTYKVRAFYGVGRSRITSDWVTILVKPAPALTYMTVNDPDVTTITTTTPEQSYDLASYISYFDQYDVPWPEAVTPEFTLPEGTKNASIDNGILKVTAPGKYPVTVSVEGIESKVINVIVNGPTGVVISDEADVLATRISGDADDVDLSKLTIKAVDLDEADWDLSQSEVVWYVDDVALTGTDYTAPANTDEDDKVHTVKAGVKSGTEEIFSNELTLTIKQARKLASLTISGDFTEDGLGIGDGYAVVFDKDIVIDARDQYGDVIDPGTDLEWTSGTKYAKVTNNESLVGIAEGDGQLTVAGAGGTVVSNTLEFKVWLKPYVAEIYADDGGTITEEEEFDLRKVTITAKDQNERAYNMTQKEIDSIDWSITDKGTIKSSDGVVYDKDAGTIKVPEGVLDYGATGTVVVTGTFTNPNGKSATGSFTISVEQKPILDSMTLGLIDEESEIETEVVKFCMSYFKVTGTDQYDRDFDMTDVSLTFVSSNEDAFKIGDADDKAISTITAGTPNTDSEITVETTNYLNVKVVSNILEMHVPRVRKLTSLEMTTVPEAIHVNTDFDMKDLGAVCFDEIHEPYSEEDLDAYPAKITYSLDKGATTATLDTAKNILTTGNKRGKITVSANAVNTSTTRIIEDEDEDAIEVGVDIWVGPIIEKIEASTDKFHVDGGNLEVTFTGKVLDDGIVVDLIDKGGNIIQTVESSGTETAQKAVLKVPANKSLTEDKEYTISYSVCGDAEGTDEYTPKSDVKVIVESHKLVKIARVEATCEVNGNIEYWQCSVCKKLFADSEAKKEITEADTVIPAIGHDWSYGKISRRAKDTKSGIITCTCRNDSTHKKNVNVEPILVKLTPSTGKSMTISWTKEALADGYDIYFSQCNSANKKIPCKFVKTVKKGKALKLKMKNLEKGFCYKSYVKAYRMVKGKKQYIAESYEVHSLSTKSYGRRTNAKNVKLKSKSVTLHKGDTFKIKGAKITPAVKSKKLVIHGKKFRYVSSDSSIATVSDKGKIKAVSSGECKIYVVSSNGVYSAITVEVEE